MTRHWRGWLELSAAVAAPLALWWAIVLIFRPEPFILPGPDRVALVFILRWRELLTNAAITVVEMLLGLLAGCSFGAVLALIMALVPRFGRMATPVITATQSLPVFAIAPLLVIWFGFGLASKVVMASIVIFFPITSAFYDGLRRTDPGLIDLARLYGADRGQMLRLIRLPAAMPGLVTGLRMAATVAPFGAIAGEWVGASSGLGLVLIQANARLQTDFMFAALATLILIAVLLRLGVERLTRDLAPWAPEADR